MISKYEIVECEVQWWASIEYLDGSGTIVQKRETLGKFVDKGDAERALAEAGFVRKEYGWVGNFANACVHRVLNELTGPRTR